MYRPEWNRICRGSPPRASALQRAIELNLNDTDSFGLLGKVMLYQGKTERAIDLLETAMRYDPNAAPDNFMHLGSGIRYSFLDAHGIYHGNPRPKYGVYAEIYEAIDLIKAIALIDIHIEIYSLR